MISAPTVRNQDFLYNTSLRAGAHTGVVYALRVQARSPQCLPLDKGRCPEGAEGSRAKHCRSPTACGGAPFFERGPTRRAGSVRRDPYLVNATRGKRVTRSLLVEEPGGPRFHVGAAISRPHASALPIRVILSAAKDLKRRTLHLVQSLRSFGSGCASAQDDTG